MGPHVGLIATYGSVILLCNRNSSIEATKVVKKFVFVGVSTFYTHAEPGLFTNNNFIEPRRQSCMWFYLEFSVSYHLSCLNAFACQKD